MKFSASLLPLLLCSPLSLAFPQLTTRAAWPDTPFVTDGHMIKGQSGQQIVFAGANWPGTETTMLPEGLQYQSIANIVKGFKDLGLNVIRLTYAIEMVDDYFSNSTQQSLQNTLTNALGNENGTDILQKILKNNPQFSKDTTRLEVFDAVAEECAKQQIWVHLDNHVSKASWCCSATDGNAWFGDEYFDVSNWQRGLGFMASHAKNWTALSSMSLRNELRQSQDGGANTQPYDWQHWFENMMPAARGINGNNSSPLIFLSGLDYDGDLQAIANGQPLGGGHSLNISSLPKGFGDKLVFEVHDYGFEGAGNDCDGIKAEMMKVYNTMNETSGYQNHAPVVMTEFGFAMDDGSSGGGFAQCLLDFLPHQVPNGSGSWMIWVGTGSYYIRDTQDQDEPYGLMNHNGSDYRNQTVVDTYIKPLVQATLKNQNQTSTGGNQTYLAGRRRSLRLRKMVN